MGTFKDILDNMMAWAGATRSTILLVDITVCLAALVAAAKLYNRHSRNPLRLPFPPGPQPSTIPFVGNIPDMPTKDGKEICILPTDY